MEHQLRHQRALDRILASLELGLDRICVNGNGLGHVVCSRIVMCGRRDRAVTTGHSRAIGGRVDVSGAPYAGRRGTSTLRRNSQTTSPRWLVPIVSTVTMPRSGLLFDSALSSTVVCA
jgi:hypothetical protein